MNEIAPTHASIQIRDLLARRIAILDGAMGTMIQQLNFGETDYRGRQFAAHPRDLKGCNDLLAITQPEAITAIHRGYLEAGADIVSTNTFNANRVSMADYDLVDQVRAINLAGVACARKAVDEFRAARPTARQPSPSGLTQRGGELRSLRRRFHRPHEPHRLALARREQSGLSGRVLRPTGGRLLRAGRGPCRRRRRHPAGRDRLRHAQPQGLPVRHR